MGLLERFRTDQAGATALLFGLAVLPIAGGLGAAVDYGRASSAQTDLQRAADAMALALVRQPVTATKAELETEAGRLLQTLVRPKPHVTLSSPKVARDGAKISVDLSASVKAAFMPVLGIGSVPVAVGSAAESTKVELALVLDNTGSMNDTITGGRKIDALQSAAKRLLQDLRAVSGQPETVKVSIVPFDTEIRLDPDSYRDKPWFRWGNAAVERPSWTGYVYERHGSYALSDAVPNEALRDTLYPVPVETEYKTIPVLKALATANGKLAAIQPLTSLYNLTDYNKLVATVDAMKPRGYTNVALGTTWGTATLSRSEPFAEGGSSSDGSIKKYMIVLTDGENNFHHVNGALSNNEAQVDKNTTTACTAAKTAGIEVFTIRLEKGDAALLSGCASSESNYFNVQSKTGLDAAFKRITDAIMGARIKA